MRKQPKRKLAVRPELIKKYSNLLGLEEERVAYQVIMLKNYSITRKTNPIACKSQKHL